MRRMIWGLLFCLSLGGCAASVPKNVLLGPLPKAVLQDGTRQGFGMLFTQNQQTIPLQGSLELRGDSGVAAFILAHGASLGYCFYTDQGMRCEASKAENSRVLYLLQQAGTALYRMLSEQKPVGADEHWSVSRLPAAADAPERVMLYTDPEHALAVELRLMDTGKP